VKIRHDAAFWRRLARFGAAHGPEWWVRYSPAFFGMAAAALVPEARRRVRRNLVQVRGERGAVRDAVDVAKTFATYAECMAEVLSNGSKNHVVPGATLLGERNLDDALGAGGVVLVTAHTAGWELGGALLGREHGREVVLVMAPEGDAEARAIHDEARAASGVEVVHVGDPLASLGLLRALRRGAVVALQLDRLPPGMRTRAVNWGGRPGAIPEGPLRLAATAGAPVLPLFCARAGWREYVIDVRPPIRMPRRPTEAELDEAAQRVADEMTRFLRRWPTQWFAFGG
jgi:lauroyl/myristoyl acyltransferase